MRLDFEIEYGLAVQGLSVRSLAHHLVPEFLVGNVDKVIGPGHGPRDPEAPDLVVELPDQLNAHGVDLDVGPVAGGDQVPADLVARLLEGRNGRRRGNAGAGRAGVDVPVGRRVLHLLDFHLGHIDVNAVQRLCHDLLDPAVIQGPLHMDQGLGPVQKLLLVDPGAVRYKKPLFQGHHGVFQDIRRQFIDIELGVLADCHVAKSYRRPLFGEHHVQHHGVLAVIVPAPLLVLRLVFGGEQQGISHKLGVVQHRLAGGRLDLVVPVHHHALAAGVHGIVVDVLLHIHSPALQVALVLGVLLLQQVLVHQIHDKEVSAALDVRDPRLPKEL